MVSALWATETAPCGAAGDSALQGDQGAGGGANVIACASRQDVTAAKLTVNGGHCQCSPLHRCELTEQEATNGWENKDEG